MTVLLASFLGATLGVWVSVVLAWRYYLAPKLAAVRIEPSRVAPSAATRRPAPRSQATATTPGFIAHDRPVTVQQAHWGRFKKATKF